ncbi:MAG: hypothetical protein A2X67_02580 [Ignavibacteria bacterium GWA2_55_11]|nr:MAG: hypothetical protein A2X67_02580 [Ignavibacteria bacterium GWA2_55_11]OGU46969.1 MAG: hypothetical protein A2X68_01680 [Ignavibacteria bacterium GWC2_56_12]OGU73984.1 MAG: hypothetical protein A3H45_15145 [Ignavibacteria bacterium RIFCSPLOWO2_02_FULL_55_14]OGU75500.1 MAG: hypothetical protein A3G43_14085 [Ignavibacteria bacterium RIFCSPLOWO2_12_FULL_56_21]HAV22290.1 DtxR family transcriptional regulator [Bacteroidota bacterium]
MASENIENYLKNIFKIQEEEGRVTTTSLSHRLQISAASVSEMIRKLAEEGHVKHTPYKGVQLTVEGRKKALRIIRRHRLWELFLVEVLKYDWDEIDEEAERLEHMTSERLEQRIDQILGYPSRDPHGHAIPTAEGRLAEDKHTPLAALTPGVSGIVSRVSDESPEILKYAARLGIVLGSRMKVKERVEFDGSLRVAVNGREQFVSSKLARHVYVGKVRREM